VTLAEIESLAELQISGEAPADDRHTQLVRADRLARALLDVLPVVKASIDVRLEHAIVFDKPGLPPRSSTSRWVDSIDTLNEKLAKITGGAA
jgi:hypothetical protein